MGAALPQTVRHPNLWCYRILRASPCYQPFGIFTVMSPKSVVTVASSIRIV